MQIAPFSQGQVSISSNKLVTAIVYIIGIYNRYPQKMRFK